MPWKKGDPKNRMKGGRRMSEPLSQSGMQKQVDSLDSMHRVDPLGGGQSENAPEKKDKQKERKFKREPDPEDRVQISEEAWNALKENQGISEPSAYPAEALDG
jgi:hypothetical protein